ncbi:MAG TPA: ABC transporter permease [Candidatus Angelobacter sp.]|nr:ABC transporter permease [Candidatus Angelobacter sp.]
MNSLLTRPRKYLGFCILAIVTATVGIGVTTGLSSISKAILHHSLKVPQPDRLVNYTLVATGDDGVPFSGPIFDALRVHPGFTRLALSNGSVDFLASSLNGGKRLSGALVNPEFFAVMELRPHRGRFIDDEDDQPGGGSHGWVAVLSYNYWRAHYGDASEAIGTSMVLNGTEVRIVGVLPPDFEGLNPPRKVEILLPHNFLAVVSPHENRWANLGVMEWNVFGRIPEGMTFSTLESALNVIDHQVWQAVDANHSFFNPRTFPSMRNGHLLYMQTGKYGVTSLLRAIREPLLEMNGLAAVLSVFCVFNLILLFAGRAIRQTNENRIRIALGARPRHLLRDGAIEALMLSAIGSVLSLPVAWGVVHIGTLMIRSAHGFAGFAMVAPSASHLLIGSALALGIASITAIIAIVPRASQLSKKSGHAREEMITGHYSRWVMGAELFAATVLIITATLCAVYFEKLTREPSGFEADHVAAASPEFIESTGKSDTVNALTGKLVDIVRASPGVQAVATTNVMPLSGLSARGPFSARRADGSFYGRGGMWPAQVSLQYFSATGTALIRGRDFVSEDLGADPVCVISASAAKALFGSEDELGKIVYSGSGQSSSTPTPYCRIIGVAENAHLKSMSARPDEVIYRLTPLAMPNILVRGAQIDLADQAVRRALRVVASTSSAGSILPLRASIEDDLRTKRLIALFACGCAGLAAVIMAIGLFGILTIEVSARRRAIGIQIALGATRLGVCKFVLRYLSQPAVAGMTAGFALALPIAGQFLPEMPMEGVWGSLAYGAGFVCLLVVILFSMIVPLRRALSVSPLESLHSE